MESVINFGRFLAIISLNVIVTLFSLFQLHVFGSFDIVLWLRFRGIFFHSLLRARVAVCIISVDLSSSSQILPLTLPGLLVSRPPRASPGQPSSLAVVFAPGCSFDAAP